MPSTSSIQRLLTKTLNVGGKELEELEKTLDAAMKPSEMSWNDNNDLLRGTQKHYDNLTGIHRQINQHLSDWAKFIESSPEANRQKLEDHLESYHTTKQPVQLQEKIELAWSRVEQLHVRIKTEMSSYVDEADAGEQPQKKVFPASKQSNPATTAATSSTRSASAPASRPPTPIPAPGNTIPQLPLSNSIQPHTTIVVQPPPNLNEIPAFHGRHLEWPAFLEGIMNILEPAPLPEAQKFALLLKATKGKARDTLSTLPVEAASYQKGLSLLREEYDRPALLADAFREEIIQCKVQTTSNAHSRADDYLQLTVKLQGLLHRLQQYDATANQAAIYTQLIKQKMHRKYLAKIGHTTSASDTLIAFKNVILNEIDLNLITERNRPNPTTPPHQQPSHDRRQHQQSGRNQVQVKSSPSQLCPVCPDAAPHPLWSCPLDTQAKFRAATMLHLCRNCLRGGHAAKDCPSKNTCRHCKRRHHTYLHLEQAPPTNRQPTAQAHFSQGPPPILQQSNAQHSNRTPRHHQPVHNNFNHNARPFQPNQQPTPSNFQASNPGPTMNRTPHHTNAVQTDSINGPKGRKQTLLATMQLTASNPTLEDHVTTTTTSLVDTGSDTSFIASSLVAKLLLLPSRMEKYAVSRFRELTSQTVTSPIHELTILDRDGQPLHIRAYEVPSILSKLKSLSDPTATNFRRIPANLLNEQPPELLIGTNYAWPILGITTETASGLHVLSTRFGTMISGETTIDDPMSENPAPPTIPTNVTFTMLTSPVEDGPEPETPDSFDSEPTQADIRKMLDRLYELEGAGIHDQSHEDEILDVIKNNITRDPDGRYSVKWPRKNLKAYLSDTRHLCYKRLQCCVAKLKSKPGQLEAYHKIFQDYLSSGYIEPAPTERSPHTYHMPHHPVFKPGSAKIRPVFDASASIKDGGISLNASLHRGPNLLGNLSGIITRARKPGFLVTADIQAAYLQVRLDKADRPSNTFYWLKDISQPVSPSNLIEYQFTCTPFGVVAAAVLLAVVIDHHLATSQHPLAPRIRAGLYVDNATFVASDQEDAEYLYRETKELFRQAGMNLRSWASTDPQLNEFLRSQGEENPDSSPNLFGIRHDATTDEFKIQIPDPDFSESNLPTKRNTLSWLHQIYDIQGWIAPVILPVKQLLRSTYATDTSKHWDHPLSPSIGRQWIEIAEQLKNFTFSVPRSLGTQIHHPTLHVFADASGTAFGSVGYLQFTDEYGQLHATLIMSRSKLVPKGNPTIARLELLAADQGSKLLIFLIKEMQIPLEGYYLYSDSTITLSWIKSSKLLPNFVRRKVRKILEVPTSTIFRHIPTTLNPADHLSRGCHATELHDLPNFKHGPPFLTDPTFPYEPQISFRAKDANHEATIEDLPLSDDANSDPASTPTSGTRTPLNQPTHTVAVVQQASAENTPTTMEPLNFHRCTSYRKLLRIMLLVLTFAYKASARRRPQPSLSDAELQILRLAQKEMPPNLHEQRRANMFLDDSGLLRCRSRIDTEALDPLLRNPVFLDRYHPTTRMIILDCHHQLQHAGPTHIIAELRQRFWIPKIRSAVKSAIHHWCLQCRRAHSRPYILPPMAELPAIRLTAQRPFRHTGVDLAGPMALRGTSPDHPLKAWVVLFTCSYSRAIALSVTTSLSAESMMHTLRRFISQHGRPDSITSDNATNFTCLGKALNDNPTLGIQWRHIAPRAPWKGGWWERLIGLTKNSLLRALGRHPTDLDSFTTTVHECQAILNSRPLTTVPADEDFHPVRPIDLLMPGRPNISAPISNLSTDDDDRDDPDYNPDPPTLPEQIITAWKRTNSATDKFHRLWTNEYLQRLREKNQIYHQQKKTSSLTPKVGTVVLIEDAQKPKSQWSLGKINKLLNYIQGLPSCAEIQTATGTYIRPISHLYDLEISTPAPDAEPAPTEADPDDQPLEAEPLRQQPRRASRNPAPNYVYFATVFICLIGQAVGSSSTTTITSPPSTLPSNPINWTCKDPHNVHPIFVPICSDLQTHRVEAVYRTPDGEPCCLWRCKSPNNSHWYKRDKTYYQTGPYTDETLKHTQEIKQFCNDKDTLRCSWEPDPECHPIPITTTCFIVEFLDKTQCIWSSTAGPLLTVDHPTLETFQCLSEATTIHDKDTNGPSSFCQSPSIQCNPYSRKFCYRTNGPMTFLKLPSTDLPLESHRYEECNFYTYKSVKDNPSHNAIFGCDPLAIFITLQRSSIFTRISHCLPEKECISLDVDASTDPQAISLPIHQLSAKNPFLVKLTIWEGPTLVRRHNLTCPTPLCQQSKECFICRPYLRYLHYCTEILLYLLLLLMALIIIALAYTGWLAHQSSSTRSSSRKPSTPLDDPPTTVIAQALPIDKDSTCPAATPTGEETQRSRRRRRHRARAVNPPPPTPPAQSSSLAATSTSEATLPATNAQDPTCSSRTQETQTSTAGWHRKFKPPKKPIFPPLAIILICLLPATLSCGNTASISGENLRCAREENGEMACSMTSEQLLIFSSAKQEICIQLQGNTNGTSVALGEIVFRYAPLKFRCIPTTNFFTREHEFASPSSRRCRAAGPCVDQHCEKVGLKDRLSEFDNEINDRPGYSYCHPATTGFSSGCVLLTEPGCLYFRVTARPTSTTIFEAFTCQGYIPYLTVNTVLRHSNGTNTTYPAVELSPGQPTLLTPHIRLTLASGSTPPISNLGATFLQRSDDQRITRHPPQPSTPTPNTLAQLVCPTRNDAASFNCTFNPNTCLCHDGTDHVRCDCANVNPSKYFEHADHLLPYQTEQHTLSASLDKHRIVLEMRAGTVTQVLMEVINATTHLNYDQSTCHLNISSFHGCHDCHTGATAFYNCTTTYGSTTGHLKCEHHTWPIACNFQGLSDTITILQSEPEINQECAFDCNNQNTKLPINGVLFRLPPIAMNQATRTEYTSNVKDSDLDLLSPLTGIWNQIVTAILPRPITVLFLGGLGIFLFCIVCRLPGLPWTICNKLHNVLFTRRGRPPTSGQEATQPQPVAPGSVVNTTHPNRTVRTVKGNRTARANINEKRGRSHDTKDANQPRHPYKKADR